MFKYIIAALFLVFSTNLFAEEVLTYSSGGYQSRVYQSPKCSEYAEPALENHVKTGIVDFDKYFNENVPGSWTFPEYDEWYKAEFVDEKTNKVIRACWAPVLHILPGMKPHFDAFIFDEEGEVGVVSMENMVREEVY